MLRLYTSILLILISFQPSWGQINNGEKLLAKADSLVSNGKPVAALSIYSSVSESSISPCEIARAEAGKGAIQQKAGNIDRASESWKKVELNCSICPSDTRSNLVFNTVEGWISQGEETLAMNLLDLEISRQPNPTWKSKLNLLRARIYFLNGEWNEARIQSEPSSRFKDTEFEIDRLTLWLQAGVLSDLTLKEAGIDRLEKLRFGTNKPKIDAAYSNLHTLLVTEHRYSEALVWAKTMLNKANLINDPEGWILAQIRVAKSAELAGKTLVALLAHHEAEKAASLHQDAELWASTCRERARFDSDRGDSHSAYIHLQRADSLSSAIVISKVINKEAKSFKNHLLPELDPFDMASTDAIKGSRPGAWPFIVALLLLGIIAGALRNFDLKRTIRRERLRTMKLHSIISESNRPKFSTLAGESPEEIVEELEAQFAISSPEWEKRINANALDFDDIIASLETELGSAVEWVLINSDKAPEAPDGLLTLLSITLHQLLPKNSESSLKIPMRAKIKNDWSGVQITLDGPETSATKELQKLFAGTSKSQTWSAVFEQTKRMAGKVKLERNPFGGYAVVLDLPHPK